MLVDPLAHALTTFNLTELQNFTKAQLKLMPFDLRESGFELLISCNVMGSRTNKPVLVNFLCAT
jgi:ABC-type transporter MlaC component